MSPDRRWLMAGYVAVAIALATLAANVPADAFVVGDAGVKLVATREALAHPSRPLSVDVPVVGHVVERSLVVLLLVASAAVQRQAFKDLRAVKLYYGRMQTDLQQSVTGGIVLSDIWWLDQVTGAHAPPPTFLFASDPAIMATARLAGAGVQSFSAVTAAGWNDAARVRAWLAGTDFQAGTRTVLEHSGMAVFEITRRPPASPK